MIGQGIPPIRRQTAASLTSIVNLRRGAVVSDTRHVRAVTFARTADFERSAGRPLLLDHAGEPVEGGHDVLQGIQSSRNSWTEAAILVPSSSIVRSSSVYSPVE